MGDLAYIPVYILMSDLIACTDSGYGIMEGALPVSIANRCFTLTQLVCVIICAVSVSAFFTC